MLKFKTVGTFEKCIGTWNFRAKLVIRRSVKIEKRQDIRKNLWYLEFLANINNLAKRSHSKKTGRSKNSLVIGSSGETLIIRENVQIIKIRHSKNLCNLEFLAKTLVTWKNLKLKICHV